MITISGLTKTFGQTTALAGINLSIARGDSVAIVGPAACGRTTLMRILATLVPPSSGRVDIGGLDAVSDVYRVRRLIAHAAGTRIPECRLRVGEYLRFVADARSQPSSAADVAAEIVGLNPETPIEALSDTLPHRLPLAAALVAAAEVVLLDDALRGLDVPGRTRLAAWLTRARERGTTVIVTANDGDDISDVCQRTMRLETGRIIEPPAGGAHPPLGSPRELVVN